MSNMLDQACLAKTLVPMLRDSPAVGERSGGCVGSL